MPKEITETQLLRRNLAIFRFDKGTLHHGNHYISPSLQHTHFHRSSSKKQLRESSGKVYGSQGLQMASVYEHINKNFVVLMGLSHCSKNWGGPFQHHSSVGKSELFFLYLLSSKDKETKAILKLERITLSCSYRLSVIRSFVGP